MAPLWPPYGPPAVQGDVDSGVRGNDGSEEGNGCVS